MNHALGKRKKHTLISVENLSVHFKMKDQTVKAVDNVSFDIYAGETIAIVGESGSGKSVTALSMMRLTDYSGGQIVSGKITFSGAIWGSYHSF